VRSVWPVAGLMVAMVMAENYPGTGAAATARIGVRGSGGGPVLPPVAAGLR